MTTDLTRRSFGAMMLASTAAACGPRVPYTEIPTRADRPDFLDGYGPLPDAGYNLPGIPTE